MVASFLSVNVPLAMDYFEVLVWPGGGEIGAILWLLSIVMVALSVQAFISIRRATILPPIAVGQMQQMFEAKQYREAIELTSTQPDFFSHIVHAGLAEAPRGFVAMEKAMQNAADDRMGKYLRSVEYLNLLGNIGPMLGLLGTVWGMILAFFTIVSEGGNPQPAKLAGALGIQLVTTLIGLMVAIPALSVYGVIRNRIDGLTTEALNSAASLLATFRPGSK